MSNSNDKRPPDDPQEFSQTSVDNQSEVKDPGHYKISDIVNRSSPEQTAAYLADMLRELQDMAEKSGHSSLGEMLEFAHREAVWRSRTGREQSGDGDEVM